VDYRFSIDIDDPLVLRLAEQWESQAALDAHLRTPHFLAFTPVLVASVDGPADFTRFEVSSSGPLLG
jgi:quinol monooxygenase YgiN